MLQTGTINFNSPSHACLAAIHPSNITNVNGRVISRSPSSAFLDIRNLSPNKLNATKKPMIGNNSNGPVLPIGFVQRGRVNNQSPNNKTANLVSPGNNLFNFQTNKQPLINSKGFKGISYDRSSYCQNHINKPADFVAQLDNQQIGYCQKCAINLASKGFSVVKKSDMQKPDSLHKPSIFDRHRLQPFHNPHLSHLVGYDELNNFIQNIDTTHSAYLNQIHRCQTIEEHYDRQYKITQQFYDSLLNLVEQMRNDHLADLQSEANKHSQQALIKEDHLKSDVQEMEIIRSDLVNSFELILQDFNSEVVQTSFNFYKQQIYTYKYKIEEQVVDFNKTIIDQKQTQLKNKLKKIENYLIQVWNDKPKNQPQPKPPVYPGNMTQHNIKTQQKPFNPGTTDRSPRSVKHLLNLQPKSDNQPKKTACRQLFEDQNIDLQENNNQFNINDHTFNNEELNGQKSPQFKNI